MKPLRLEVFNNLTLPIADAIQAIDKKNLKEFYKLKNETLKKTTFRVFFWYPLNWNFKLVIYNKKRKRLIMKLIKNKWYWKIISRVNERYKRRLNTK